MAKVNVGERKAAKKSFKRIHVWLYEAAIQHDIFDPDEKLSHDLIRLERIIEQLDAKK